MTSAKTHREVERKLRVHALFQLPELSAVSDLQVEQRPAQTLEATYFDTPDLALFRWGITLRRRAGGSDDGWHVKFPVRGADQSARDELRLPLGTSEHVPAQLVDIVSPLLLGHALQPVVSLRTDRQPFDITRGNGRVEFVDDTVSILDAGSVVAVFRELEVEAAHANDTASLDLMNDVIDHLLQAGAVVGGSSKAASALGPRASAPPDVRTGPMPGPNGLAADALRAMISTHVRNLMLNDVNVRRELPDSVHQMRVSARRLRSVLTAFAPLFEAEWADGLRGDLKWLASELGAIRDTEVLHARLSDHSRELPDPFATRAKETLDAILSRREQGALAGALAALRSDRHQFVIEDLVEAANSPRFTDLAYQSCREALPPAMTRSWRTLNKAVHRLDIEGPSDVWHQARIKAKRARYTAEAIAPIFGKRAERLARSLADVTDVLGSHQDAYVAQEFLQGNTEGTDGPTGFALGLLFEREYVHEMDDRRAFRDLWPSTLRAAKASGLIDS